MENKYQWNLKGFGKKIDPDKALAEIQKAEVLFGKITPENVLKIAEDESSVIHDLFDWEDSRAAHNWRLSQARNIINNIEVKVVSNNGPLTIPAFEISRDNGNSQYKLVETMTVNERKYIIDSTISTINTLKNKLATLKSLDKAIYFLDSAIDELKNSPEE